MVKHLPTMWETWIQSLGQEDLLEKEMATHSSILAWKSHGQRSHEHVGLRVTKKSVMTEQLNKSKQTGQLNTQKTLSSQWVLVFKGKFGGEGCRMCDQVG